MAWTRRPHRGRDEDRAFTRATRRRRSRPRPASWLVIGPPSAFGGAPFAGAATLSERAFGESPDTVARQNGAQGMSCTYCAVETIAHDAHIAQFARGHRLAASLHRRHSFRKKDVARTRVDTKLTSLRVQPPIYIGPRPWGGGMAIEGSPRPARHDSDATRSRGSGAESAARSRAARPRRARRTPRKKPWNRSLRLHGPRGAGAIQRFIRRGRS